MTISRYWRSLKTKDFDRIDRADTVVILPLAAIEQHGPHLPLDVDLRINEGIVAAAAERAPENPPFLILPTQAIGFSAEHTAFLGSLTWSPTSSLDLWTTRDVERYIVGHDVAFSKARKYCNTLQVAHR